MPYKAKAASKLKKTEEMTAKSNGYSWFVFQFAKTQYIEKIIKQSAKM